MTARLFVSSSLKHPTLNHHRLPVVSDTGSSPILSTAEANGQTDTEFHEIWIKPHGAYSRNARGQFIFRIKARAEAARYFSSEIIKKSWYL